MLWSGLFGTPSSPLYYSLYYLSRRLLVFLSYIAPRLSLFFRLVMMFNPTLETTLVDLTNQKRMTYFLYVSRSVVVPRTALLFFPLVFFLSLRLLCGPPRLHLSLESLLLKPLSARPLRYCLLIFRRPYANLLRRTM